MITNVGVQGILMILVMVQVILVNDNSDDWEIVKEVERQLRSLFFFNLFLLDIGSIIQLIDD